MATAVAAKAQILVTPQWLSKHFNDDELVILDATIPVPGAPPTDDSRKQIIPGALRFDIEAKFSNIDAPFPHTMPAPADFEKNARQLGINSNHKIIVYDDIGIFSAPRAWWMFAAMGHNNVSILNGGLPAWLRQGLPAVASYKTVKNRGDFTANYRNDYFVDMPLVEQASRANTATIIDARNADRFFSRVDEPRPNLRRGNIPRSINLPFSNTLEDGAYKETSALEEIFSDLLPDKHTPLYFSCGSGITACIDAVAAKICGFEKVSVYDGSWCEWGSKVLG